MPHIFNSLETAGKGGVNQILGHPLYVP